MNFWYDIWLTNIRPTRNSTPDQINEINPPANSKYWNLDTLKRYLLESIIQQINNVLVPIKNIEHKICWKFTPQALSLLNLQFRLIILILTLIQRLSSVITMQIKYETEVSNVCLEICSEYASH